MPPKIRSTRSRSNNRPSQREIQEGDDDIQQSLEDSDDDDTSVLTGNIEKSLSTALNGIKRLTKEDASLRKENKMLKAKLEATEEDLQPKRGRKAGQTVAGLQRQIKSLEAEIKTLKKAQERDKREIRQLQMKEAKRDAAELEEAARDEDDPTHFFRKLLRQFSNLVSDNSLEGGEECPICMEGLEVDKATSFPCQHVICTECFRGLETSTAVLKCPACRQECQAEDIEVIRYTASSQWDALLDIASEFVKVDQHKPDDIITSGDEGTEEPFIENDESENRSASSRPTSPDPLQSTPEPEYQPHVTHSQPQDGPSSQRRRNLVQSPGSSPELTPREPSQQASSPLTELSRESEPSGSVPRTSEPGGSSAPGYSESSVAEKRRRMRELAEAQSQKRQRL